MQIIFEVLHLAWLSGITVALVKLWDRIEPVQDQPIETIDSAWEPVDLDDEREFNLQELEKRREIFKV